MNSGALGNLLTFCAFGAAGVFAAGRTKVHVRVHTWVLTAGYGLGSMGRAVLLWGLTDRSR
jgi:hypothetical protein